jgi:hypothetical protein
VDDIRLALSAWAERLELYERAYAVASRLCASGTEADVPEDLKTVVSYWKASVLGADRASHQLLSYARASKRTP